MEKWKRDAPFAAFTAGAAAVRRPRRESLVSPRNGVRCDALFVALITA